MSYNESVLLICIGWYVLGFIGGILCSKYDSPEERLQYVTVGDFIATLTIGGIGGLITLFAGLRYLVDNCKGLDKKLF